MDRLQTNSELLFQIENGARKRRFFCQRPFSGALL